MQASPPGKHVGQCALAVSQGHSCTGHSELQCGFVIQGQPTVCGLETSSQGGGTGPRVSDRVASCLFLGRSRNWESLCPHSVFPTGLWGLLPWLKPARVSNLLQVCMHIPPGVWRPHGLFLREFPFGKYVQLLAEHLFTLLLGFIGWMSQHPLWHIQSLGQGPVKTQPSCEVPLGDSCLPYRHVQRYGSQYVFPILGHKTNAMKAKEGISLISMSVSADNPLCYGSEEEVSSF